jgi:hypothetical protein
MSEDKGLKGKSPGPKKVSAGSADPQPPLAEVPAGGVVVPSTGGGVVAAGADDIATWLPSGAVMLDVDPGKATEADLKKAAPAFGNVLSAIGNAVAASQKALDDALLSTVKKLNDTTIDVVNQVVIELNDDGVPYADEEHTHLVKNTVSVLNYYTPVFHAWKNVSISMDLTVGAFHAEQGFQFASKQANTSIGGGFSWSGAFGGWFSASHSSSQQSVQSSSQSDAAWSSGQLLVDAELGPRAMAKFPPATEIPVGPQILVAPGKISEQKTGSTVNSRSIDLAIEVRKSSGAPNPHAAIDAEAPGLLKRLLGPDGTTAATAADENGKMTMQLTRNIPLGTTGFQQFQLTIILGDMRKPYNVTL